ncbi:hypothetical protein [Rhizobium sullae]|uniref:hypothetical protein n=1 Tax=Rhizobium sullae TaxID=50338 RepID=UPI000B35CB73|nr:hypothetical protein [Rhizobium sullae]
MNPSTLAAMGCALVALSLAAPAHAIVPSDPPGTYERNDESGGAGSIELERIGTEWRVTVVVGGVPSGPDSATTAADCGFIVQGDFSGNDFRGRVVTVGFLPGLDEGTPAEPGLSFAFSRKGEIITVKNADSGLCNAGILGGHIINGNYIRTYQK